MKLSRRSVLSIGVSVLIIIAVTVILLLSLGKRSETALSRLALPSNSGVLAVEGWEFDGESTSTAQGSREQLGRQWVRVGSDGYSEMLGQIVYDHDQVLAARYVYWTDDPIRSIEEDYGEPDLIASGMIESSANDVRLYCIGGGVEICQTWYYWARYGQYVVKVLYTGDTGISFKKFNSYIRNVENNIEKALQVTPKGARP